MIIGKTKSVCPVCLRVVDAQKRSEKDGIYLDKRCDEHGAFSALIWEGNLASYLRWNSENTAVDPPREGRAPEKGCRWTAAFVPGICARAAACCWS